MKRFLVFRYRHYYPEGGWKDFVGDFDGFDQAKKAARKKHPDMGGGGQVIDLQGERFYSVGHGDENSWEGEGKTFNEAVKKSTTTEAESKRRDDHIRTA